MHLTPHDVESHVVYNIANAPVRTYPFPHFFVHPVFPDDFYVALRKSLPFLDTYRRLDETGTLLTKGTYPERFVCSLADAERDARSREASELWAQLGEWMRSDRFALLLLDKFDAAKRQRYGDSVTMRIASDARLVRDFSNYAIAPHTDTPAKLVSLLFYLPPDDSKRHLGTSIYVPKDPKMRCEGTRHHEFDKFRRAATAQYLPNSLFGFFKTDAAFHGVEPISEEGVERDLLLYNVYLKKLVSKGPPDPSYKIQSAPTWPWEVARLQDQSEPTSAGA